MPRPKNAKVWNEDLRNALRSRQLLAQRLGKRNEHLWRDGFNAIVAVRKDIYCYSNGRVVNLPQNLKKTVFNLCMDVIRGVQDIYPDGYYENNPTQNNGQPLEKNWDNDPYLRQMKNRGGSYAILRAFDHSGVDTLTKEQIVSVGQQFCDEQMDSNFMAGRTYGAWKSKDTLKKHGLVTENGGATFVEGRGFRTPLGAYTYNLTRDGQKFIAAMKRKWPQDFVGGSRGGGSAGGGGGAEVAAAASFAPLRAHRFGGGAPGLASPSAVARRAGSRGEHDEQELRQWVAFADVGEIKTFKVGKDRRQHLHNACDQLEAEIPGLRLSHDSHGASRSRELVVEIMHKEESTAPVARAAGSKHTFDDSFEDSPTRPKHARHVPPSVAAAQAAERRLAEQLALKKEKDEFERALKASILDEAAKPTQSPGISAQDDADNLEKAIELSLAESEQKPAARTQRTRQETIDELLGSSSDEDEDFKKAAERSIRDSKRPPNRTALAVSEVGLVDSKPPARRELFKKTDTEIIDILSDDDEDDYVILSPKQPEPSPSSKASAEDQEVICLDDSQQGQEVIEIDETKDDNVQYSNESQDSVVILDEQVEPLYVAAKHSTSVISIRPKVTVLIDNRERNRNVTPRELRMQLTFLVTQGAIHTLWPSGMPACEVQEASLPVGDFVFEVERTSMPQSSQSKRLAMAVERKRVGDLVQRSVGGDHWQQFLRMRDSMHHSVFLVEHDTRSASRFTAYGSQNLQDGWNPLGTLIEDEQAIFLFFGRALLSSRSTKFIQTKDEQASLRAVGALGLVASLSGDSNLISEQVASAEDGPTALKDKLIKCGIPWQLVRQVSKLLSSLKYANACYSECADDECRSQLLVPFIDETTFGVFSSTKEGWSEAVYRALTSDASNVSATKLLFQDNKDAVSDHGKFLSALYSDTPLQGAINGALEDPMSTKAASRKRKVVVEIPAKHAALFPEPASDEDCFFALSLTVSNPLDIQVDTIILQTDDGHFTSDRLFVHLLPAKKLVSSIKEAMPAPGGDYMTAAKDVASSINNDCHHETMKSGRDRRVVLLCGLGPALDSVAKDAGYRTEIRAMVDVVLAQLMIAHDLVVIQSVRLKGDNEMIVQQLALACFHYHMLPNKK